MKKGVGRTEKSSGDTNAISRRREHAKQLANLAYSDDPTSATSTSTNDSAYNMNTTIISPAANNNNSNTSFFDQRPPTIVQSSNSSRRTNSRPRTNSNKSATSSNSNNSANDAFGSDPFASFDAFGVNEPSSKYSSKDFNELDFFANQMAGATTPVYQAKEQPKRAPRRKSQPVSLDHFFTDDDAASFCSTNDLSTIDGGSINSNGVSAAARRRMRSHMQKHQSSDVSVVSNASMARSRSSPQMPPSSPSPNPRYAKHAKNSGWGNEHHSPFRTTGSATSSTANYSSSSPGVNLFDSETDGFTFDAFGLDESQINREVSSAMKDIMGNGGFSIFDEDNVSGSNSESGHGSGSNSVSSGKNNFSRQDSFSGHQTDASDNSFEVNNWESSPNPSRGPSPVPLHFKASPVTPQKKAVTLSSVQKRRLQRSAQRGATTSVTPQRGNNLRQIQSEPPKSKSDFGAFANDPFSEDPFASSDDGGRLSDLFAGNNDNSTSRRLYSETQSDVHDYYASGSMTTAANSLMDSITPKNASTPSNRSTPGSNKSNYARSDIGVSHRMSFEAAMPKAPAFFELPPAEEDENQSMSDQSDDMDQIQDDLAAEFAKDIVRRISPTSQGSNQRSAPGRRIQYGDDRIHESDSDDQGPKQTNAQHAPVPETSKPYAPSASRFGGSFRSRYERSRSASALQKGNTPTAATTTNEIERSSYHGSLRSSYTASKRQSLEQKPEEKPVPKWQQTQNNEARIEEKKEDDVSPSRRAPGPSPQPVKMNSLRARWEAKTRVAPVEKPVQKAPPKPSAPSGQTKKSIGKLDNTFEMLTPDIIEQRRQMEKKEKFNNLRKSMGVVDEPTPEKIVEQESPSQRFQRSYAKPDVGSTPSHLSNVQLRKVSDSPASPVGRKMTYRERREMELEAQRKKEEEEAQKANTQVSQQPVEKKLSYRERREMELEAQRLKEEKTQMQSPQSYNAPKSYNAPQSYNTPSKSPQNHNTPNTDVASLIRKRINANKKRDSPPQESQKSSSNTFAASAAQKEIVRQPQNEVESSTVESPRKDPSKMLENMFASRAPPAAKVTASAKLENMFASRAPPPTKPAASANLENFFAAKTGAKTPSQGARSVASVAVPEDVSQSDAKSMLSGFLAKRSPSAVQLPEIEAEEEVEVVAPAPAPVATYSGSGVALKDDPKFERYFRMLKMGLPLQVAKHAMARDGLDPDILDMDHNKPMQVSGVPMKDDPKFTKYFKMLKIGIAMDQVKHSMERDGLNPSAMDQDHNLPVQTVEKKKEVKKKETHRRARLHWKSFGKIMKNSLWDTVQSEVGGISIDEDEFEDLFQAELKASNVLKTTTSNNKKKGAQIRVIESKRANNGGIILARVKLTHDQMADAVDRIDASTLTAEQIENVIEYLPTKEERDALEKYMLEGGQDAAEKFDGLCECEKFMVSMMTVKHAKRKIRALLFKLQFMTCMESIAKDAEMIDTACDELINSNRLRQLLGIILEFGNRLNTAGNSKSKAGGFSLESLSKLSQAKAFDKKTTFLHYIILIVERNNELLLKFYDDIPAVVESDNIFWDQCQQDLEEVENQLENVRRMALHEARANDEATGVSDDDSLGELELTLEEEVGSLRASKTGLFTLGAIKQVSALREKIERTRAKCVRLKQYFGVGKATEPQEIFSVFSQFTTDFKKAKEQVFSKANKRLREERKKARKTTPKKQKPREPMMKASSHQPSMNKLFGDIQQRQPSNTPNRLPQDPRAGLLSSIKERQSPSERSNPSPRAGLMDAIQQRPSSAPANPRAGLLDAIKKRPSVSSPAADPRAGMLDAIKKRQSPAGPPSDPRAGLLDAIKKRQPTSENSPPAENPRLSLLSAIKQRNPENETVESSFGQNTKPMGAKPNGTRSPREAMRHHRRRAEASHFRHGD